MGFPIENATDKNTANATVKTTVNTTANTTGSATERSRTESMSVAQWIAVAGGLGLSPIAPGTFGSVGGAFLFLGVLWMGAGNPVAFVGLYLALVGVLFGLGVWASGRAEHEWARHDDNRIVIDEVVGQLIALSPLVFFSFPLSLSLSAPGSPFFWLSPFLSLSPSFFLSVVTAFVLFRLFDVWKPGAIRWAERRFESGLGVMADDVVAGLYSAVALCLIWGLIWGLVWGLAWGFGFGNGTEGFA